MGAWPRASARYPSRSPSAESEGLSRPPTQNQTVRSAIPTAWAIRTRRRARSRSTHPEARLSREPSAPFLPSSAGSTAEASSAPKTSETEHEETADEEGAREEGHEESSGLTGPMALGGTTVTEPSAGASPPADEGNGGSDSVTTPEIQTNEPEVPEALVSHSPGTEPSSCSPKHRLADPPPPPVDPPAAEPPAVEARRDSSGLGRGSTGRRFRRKRRS